MRRSSSPRYPALKPQPPVQRSPERVYFQRTVIGLYLSVVVALGIIVILFFSGRLIVAGVPSSIILHFLQDGSARRAYFGSNNEVVHERIIQMGVVRRLKDFYRPQFTDEARLDLHVHQILYDRTDYIDERYEVNERGRLMLTKPGRSLMRR
ncbi:hypothetical protein IQ268_07405 [Oculatella sp. LEGE 06141]|nr:hypothetical protein [Oculatella sp. LEGE 06141]